MVNPNPSMGLFVWLLTSDICMDTSGEWTCFWVFKYYVTCVFKDVRFYIILKYCPLYVCMCMNNICIISKTDLAKIKILFLFPMYLFKNNDCQNNWGSIDQFLVPPTTVTINEWIFLNLKKYSKKYICTVKNSIYR